MNDLTTDGIRNTKWEFYGVAGLPLYVSIYSSLYTRGFIERFGTPTEAVAITRNKTVEVFIKTKQLIELAEKVLPIFLEQQWKYFDEWKQEEALVDVYTKNVRTTDLTRMSEMELRAAFRAYRAVFARPFVTNNVIEPISFYMQGHLKDMLIHEGIAEHRVRELMDRFGQSAEASYVKQCTEAYRRAKTPDDVATVLRTYHYIRNDYTGVKPVTEEYLQVLAETTPYKAAVRETEPGISKRAHDLLSVLQIIATMQDVRKYRFLEMVAIADMFGRELARRNNIDFKLVEQATWEELESGIPDISILRERIGLCVSYWSVDGTITYPRAEAERIAHDFDTYVRVTDTSTIVNGICASKGIVRGKVVVVFQEHEFSKVQPGDILVTMMTRPEFLPVMHRAAAFVCDEGGITSHAAIVAREMKKPCVIATNIGSKVFKDGDMVEVDATNGIVRKV